MVIQVYILTPDCIFYNENAEELVLPTSTGQIGVLNDHTPLITALDIGPILLGGFALVKENQITILVSEAVAASTVNKGKASKTLEKATNYLNQVTEEKAKVEATFAFKRARAQFQIVQWKKFLDNFVCRNIVAHTFESFVVLENYPLSLKK